MTSAVCDKITVKVKVILSNWLCWYVTFKHIP